MRQLSILLFLILSSHVQAELKWESKAVKKESRLTDKVLELVFKAKNTSAEKILVKSVKPSCDCMTITSTFPLEVNPAEEFVVKVNYDTLGKVGLNRGRVIVETSNKKETLLVEVSIPTAVTLTPRFLIWKKGERGAKIVNIEVHPDYKGSIDSAHVKSETDEKLVVVQMEKKEGSVVVKLTPDQELGKKRTWVIISGKDEKGEAKEYRVYLIFN